MSRNGSGVYSLPPGSTVTNGDTSDASDVNTPLQDIAQDLNTARPIVAGGTGATSASGARTALAVPGLAAADTVTGNWTITGDWTFTGAADLSGATVTLAAGEIGTADLANDAVTLAKVADAALSGADATLVTGTAGTAGNLVQWNADGDAVDGPDVLDEDDMASDSAAAVPTQQSVKAYVDAINTSWTLISQQSPTSGNTVIWTGLGDYNELRLVFFNLNNSEAAEWRVQFSSDGSSYATTGYTSTCQFAATDGIRINAGLFAGINHAHVDFFNFNTGAIRTSAGGLIGGVAVSTGFQNSTVANVALRVITDRGNLTSGSVALYGR